MISNDRAKILFELDKETKEKYYILPNPNEVLLISHLHYFYFQNLRIPILNTIIYFFYVIYTYKLK
jgi:hypothetical protein